MAAKKKGAKKPAKKAKKKSKQAQPEGLILSLHKHHSVLVEAEYNKKDILGRLVTIKKYKPKNERALRLKLYRQIPRAKLPKVLIPYDRQLRRLPPTSRSFNSDRWAIVDKVSKLLGWSEPTKLAKKLHKENCLPRCPFKSGHFLNYADKKGNFTLAPLKKKSSAKTEANAKK